MARKQKNKPVVVIGSINMDLVCRIPYIPRPGETILGSDLATIPGGKGANQAVAAAKLGADVYMIGRVGSDDFGMRLVTGLKQHGVRTRFVTVSEGAASGCAMILVDGKGENSIIVAPGANALLTPEDIDAAERIIRQAACVVLQLEIPLATVQHALDLCRRLGVYTILDPAPVPPRGLPRALLNVDLISPNQSEAEMLLGPAHMGRMKRSKRIDAKQIGGELIARGAGAVVLKLGARGSMLIDDRIEHEPGFKVKVVDTTAAGDAFTAALAVARSEGKDLRESLRLANAAGALTCTGFGAQPSLPARSAVDALLRKST